MYSLYLNRKAGCVVIPVLTPIYPTSSLGRFRATIFGVLIPFFILPHLTLAQDTRVVVECSENSTATKPVALVKWYSQDLVYGEGVNVYRKPEGSLTWTKLNDRPIVRKANVSAQAHAADPDLEVFVTMVESATTQELKEGMLQFNLVIKSFQSNEFAAFLGIFYEDHVPEAGRYQYKVNRIRNGRELPLGVSSVIDATDYEPAPPIEDIEVFQKGKKLNFN